MKVDLLLPSGYCQGINSIIDKLKKERKENPSRPIYILGELIHNKNIHFDLDKLGVKTLIPGENLEESLSSLPKNSIVVSSAHGVTKKEREAIEKAHLTLLEGTCPIILNTYRKMLEEKGEDKYFIGDKEHAETKAALDTIEGLKHLPSHLAQSARRSSLKGEPYVFNQSTLSEDELYEYYRYLLDVNPKVRVVDTRCPILVYRYDSFAKMVKEKDYDLLIVVGGKKSRNSNTLLDIYYKLTKNRNYYLVEDLEELKQYDLKGVETILLAGGTSTPKRDIDEIYHYLKLNHRR
jgi:4-hydroxy-3-methylbut-2-enyl diphosphate reductase